jgi:hypothetical protein
MRAATPGTTKGKRMTIRHIATATVFAATLGLGLANAQTNQTTPGAAARESVPGTTGTGIPGAPPSAQPNPTPGLSQAQGTQAPSATNPGSAGTTAQTQDRGMAPGGAATGTTTQGGADTAGGGRSDSSTPPAATTRHTEPRTANAPVPGANSFTEGQARARMSDAGFNDVQDLRLDDQGVWRGRAMRGGQQTGVALDFQGNVVAAQ